MYFHCFSLKSSGISKSKTCFFSSRNAEMMLFLQRLGDNPTRLLQPTCFSSENDSSYVQDAHECSGVCFSLSVGWHQNAVFFQIKTLVVCVSCFEETSIVCVSVIEEKKHQTVAFQIRYFLVLTLQFQSVMLKIHSQNL